MHQHPLVSKWPKSALSALIRTKVGNLQYNHCSNIVLIPTNKIIVIFQHAVTSDFREKSCVWPNRKKMSEPKNDITGEAKAESNEDKGAMAVPVEDPLPDIFKLKMDHFEEVFDSLYLKELFVFGQTCKRLRALVAHYFQEYYKNVYISCTDKGIHVGDWKITGFSPCIRNMTISGDNWQQTIASNRFNALTDITLEDVSLTEDKIACIKDILGKTETVRLNDCKVNNEFFASFLAHCTSIKELHVRIPQLEPSEIIIGTDNNWLLHEYPTLERLDLLSLSNVSKIKELKTFFEQNPTVKSFLTTSEFLWSNKDIIQATKTNLDVLVVVVSRTERIRSSLYVLLKDLYDKGFYKQLKMHIAGIDQRDVTAMVSNGGLVELYPTKISSGIDLCPLVNLKVLYLGDGINGSFDLESLATALVNLERLEYKMADRYYTYPFLRLSIKLKEIKISLMLDCIFDPVQLLNMNKEREKLANARKVVIYVPEYVFMMNKLEDETSLSLVELKRSEWDGGR